MLEDHLPKAVCFDVSPFDCRLWSSCRVYGIAIVQRAFSHEHHGLIWLCSKIFLLSPLIETAPGSKDRPAAAGPVARKVAVTVFDGGEPRVGRCLRADMG